MVTSMLNETGLAVDCRAEIVLVRDRKRGDEGPTLTFTMDEWAAFIAGVKAGQFDTRAA